MCDQEFDDAFSKSVRTDRGFSIIEMLIAISVIVFGLASIVGISAYVSRTNSTSAALNVLAAAAQDQTDRLRTARWTSVYTDPTLSVGGYVPSVAANHSSQPSFSGFGRADSAVSLASPAALVLPTPSPNPTPIGGNYTYTLDPENPHHATASNTPVGDLNINWQVRQGATPELRYVTIRVVQVNPPERLAEGITVTTIIVRN